MAKAQSTSNAVAKLTPEAAQESLNNQVIGKEETHPISKADGFALMQNVKKSELQELTSQYFSFDKKGSFFFIFYGMSKATVDGKIIDVVMLEDEQENKLINGNAVMVNALMKVETLPCYVRADYEGDVKSAKGTYKDIKVYTFPYGKKKEDLQQNAKGESDAPVEDLPF